MNSAGSGYVDRADRDLPLAHRLEQRGLNLRRRAIHLVGEHEIVEERPLAKHERAVLRPVDLRAGEIGRQEIRGELQAVEVALDAVAQHLDRAGLREAGRALHEQVAVAEQHGEHPVEQAFLTDDETFEMRLELKELFLQRHGLVLGLKRAILTCVPPGFVTKRKD